MMKKAKDDKKMTVLATHCNRAFVVSPEHSKKFLEHKNNNDNDEAILTRSFWDENESDCEYECFCKPIRTPRMNSFFGMDGYNCHPLQKYALPLGKVGKSIHGECRTDQGKIVF